MLKSASLASFRIKVLLQLGLPAWPNPVTVPSILAVLPRLLRTFGIILAATSASNCISTDRFGFIVDSKKKFRGSGRGSLLTSSNPERQRVFPSKLAFSSQATLASFESSSCWTLWHLPAVNAVFSWHEPRNTPHNIQLIRWTHIDFIIIGAIEKYAEYYGVTNCPKRISWKALRSARKTTFLILSWSSKVNICTTRIPNGRWVLTTLPMDFPIVTTWSPQE